MVAFIILSGFLLYVSRSPLRHPGSHGFYRFFAWESMLALVLLNMKWWFSDPLSLAQSLSWLFMVISMMAVLLGYNELRKKGGNEPGREDASLYHFEKTSQLVTTGIYRYIRHPLYGSLLFLTWGIFLKNITLTTGLLALASSVFLYITAIKDEQECIVYFGDAYEKYCLETKMFIPFLF